MSREALLEELAEVQPERWASLVVDNDDPARPILVDPGGRSAAREL